MLWRFVRSLMFRLDPEWAHHLGAFYIRLRGTFTQGKPKPIRWTKGRRPELAGMQMDSPLGVAAGFDKNGSLVLGLRSLGFGFVEVGTVTPRPQPGNPKPRMFRVPEGRALINRMGFNSEGAPAVAARLAELRALYPVRFPVGVNLGKNKDTPLERAGEDYVEALRHLYAVGDYIVVNLSSPNTPGLTSLQEASYLAPLLAQVREERDRLARSLPGAGRPLFLKLSPDLLPDARKTAVEVALGEGFTGIIASNTSRRRDFPELLNAPSQVVGEEGGLSGLPLRADALKQLAEVRAWAGPKATVISVGGLGGPEDARARLEAGADLLQVYTEFVYSGPGYPHRIAKALSRS
jgi:dihydroorotate dehydrogenase